MKDARLKCPKCGSKSLAVEVRTWFNFEDGEPDTFDTEDGDYIEPLPGGDAICRSCQHQWQAVPALTVREKQ